MGTPGHHNGGLLVSSKYSELYTVVYILHMAQVKPFTELEALTSHIWPTLRVRNRLFDLIQAKRRGSQSESSSFLMASSIAGTALQNASHCSIVILIPAPGKMYIKKGRKEINNDTRKQAHHNIKQRNEKVTLRSDRLKS